MDSYRIDFCYNKVRFDVLYFAGQIPYLLILGVRAKTFYFEIEISSNLDISTYLGDKYSRLCEVLGLQYDPNNPFKPKCFFEEFNKQVPRTAYRDRRPKPHEIAPFRRKVEDADKIYFAGWRRNNIHGDHVRPENLEKTRSWLASIPNMSA